MMESAQAGLRNHDRIRRRLPLDRTAIRRVLIESIVDAILVVITDVVTYQPAEMLFVQRDDVVEDLAATTTHPAFATRFAKAPTSSGFVYPQGAGGWKFDRINYAV